MDKRPKRTRDKYNPYILQSEKDKNIYKVIFNNIDEIVNIEISKEIFEALDEFEKEDARQIQKKLRHHELNHITEKKLNKRAFYKQKNVDEILITKINNEKLEEVMDKLTREQRRRILLYYDYEMTMEEISIIDGCSKQSVQESIEWGMKKIRKFFEKF